MTKTQKNLVYNTAYQILTIILPLITAPYISRVLGAESLGIYSYTYSIVNYFMLFALLGINNYGNREIAKVRNSKEERSKLFWEIYFIQLITSILVLLIYVFYLTVIINAKYKLISIIQILFIFSTMIDINWYFFGIGEFKITVIRNTILKIVSLLFIFCFVKNKEDLVLYTLIMSASVCISQLSMWIVIKKSIKFIKINFVDLLKHIKPILILFIPVLSYSIYKIMDKIMLGNMCGMTEVGLYENAEKIINIPQGIVTAVGTVMLSQISSIHGEDKNENIDKYLKSSFKYLSIISIAIVFGLMSIGKEFSPIFFGKEYIETGNIIQILSIIILFITWANILRTQYLIPLRMDKIYVISTIIGGVFNFFINLILIPKYNIYGAAIGTIVAEFLVMFYQMINVNKKIKIIVYLKDSLFYIFNGLIMLVIVCFMNNIIYGNIISLICKIIVGAFIYIINSVIYLWLINDIYILEIVKKIKSKV